jgi:hypothetical protein
MDDAENAFEHHRLAGAGAADHHQRLAALNGDVDAVQHRLRPEGLADVVELDMGLRHRRHSLKSSEVIA